MINQKTNILRPAHPILHDDHEQMADLEDFLHMEMRLLRCFPDSFINRNGEAILIRNQIRIYALPMLTMSFTFSARSLNSCHGLHVNQFLMQTTI